MKKKSKIKTGPYQQIEKGNRAAMSEDFSIGHVFDLDDMIKLKKEECRLVEYKNEISMLERLKPYVELNSLLYIKIMQNLERI